MLVDRASCAKGEWSWLRASDQEWPLVAVGRLGMVCWDEEEVGRRIWLWPYLSLRDIPSA